MNKKIVILGVLLVVGLSLASIIFVSTGSAYEAVTIHLVERATNDVVIDVGDSGDSVGDLLTFANEVFDENNAEKVGTDNGYCIRTVVGEGASWICSWTLILDDGQIMVNGPFYDASDSALAITGGTGAYQNVRGQLSLHARNAEGSEYDFVYEIFEEPQ